MPPPKARTCYICGRPTLLPGYAQHVIQCRELFEKREILKPLKERRQCPPDPMMYSNSNRGYNDAELAFANDAAMKSFETTLAQCRYCGRTFLPEKLAMHNKSCTSSNPARAINPGGSSGNSLAASMNNMSINQGGQQVSRSMKMNSGNEFDDVPVGRRGSSNSGMNNSYGGNGGQGGMSFKQQLADGYLETPDYGHLIKCKECGRNFNPVSYDK